MDPWTIILLALPVVLAVGLFLIKRVGVRLADDIYDRTIGQKLKRAPGPGPIRIPGGRAGHPAVDAAVSELHAAGYSTSFVPPSEKDMREAQGREVVLVNGREVVAIIEGHREREHVLMKWNPNGGGPS